jgi:hypothetical protein
VKPHNKAPPSTWLVVALVKAVELRCGWGITGRKFAIFCWNSLLRRREVTFYRCRARFLRVAAPSNGPLQRISLRYAAEHGGDTNNGKKNGWQWHPFRHRTPLRKLSNLSTYICNIRRDLDSFKKGKPQE